MPLLTYTHVQLLLANGRRRAAGLNVDPPPVVKLFTPDGAATWLLTELDPDDPDVAFGLCDLGLGTPELGRVRLSELTRVHGPLGLPVERDRSFRPSQSISAYVRRARRLGRIDA
ncbi:DUF2958 domain-containing protein [Phenylobacterium deserti]|uniref:DUF2958 domain-containing protein n=1 Tax=Phenylobacterium deserti TaxID=1914756 RepID=A0A328AAT2_9CAUL|nr:DUF2958 domain-containing protein [Phenylobacterium deserti]RAK51306.1 DUF2958 domain-containing protein [Phenylobacterium deserti]